MEEPLSVCLLNDSFPPLIDGVANAVLNYAQIIQRQYGRATVATPRYPGVTDDYPFRVVRYSSLDVTRLVGYRAGNPFSAQALDELTAAAPDIIHSHCPLVSTMLGRSLRCMRDGNVPLIMTYHTKFDIDFEKVVHSRFLQERAVRILVDNVTACDEVWVVSRGAGENLRHLGYTGEYRVMDNGVDVPRGRVDDGETAALDAEFRLEPDVPVFLFVGRLMWYKGIRLILEGLAEILRRGFRFRMLFVGDGTDRAEIEKTAAEFGLTPENCTFVGSVRDREKLRAFYCRADLFLFPSTFDTNGIVVREAAACGLGSVLIRGSCAAEGIEDGRCCLLINENTASMADALETACRNLDRMHEIGRHAMEEIYFSWEDSVARAVDRYRTVIDNKRRGVYARRRRRSEDLFEAAGDLAAFVERIEQLKQKLLVHGERREK